MKQLNQFESLTNQADLADCHDFVFVLFNCLGQIFKVLLR